MVSLSPNFTSPNTTSVSFSGTASFAPLPFPPSEHPLPPPPPGFASAASANADTSPPHDKSGPPPPYSEQPNVTEQQAAAPGVVLFPQPVLPAVPAPLPAASFDPARSPSLPQQMYAPILTPWPPVPLRHIDAYLAGTHAYPQVYPVAQPYPVFVPTSMPSPPASLIYPIGSEHVTQVAPRIDPSPPQGAAIPVAPVPVQQPLPLAQPSAMVTATSMYGSPTETTVGACMHPGCYAPVFCELSPCGCRLCRDHLGWVIRNVRTLDVGANKFIGPKEAKETKNKTKKVFRCVSCGAESSKAEPPSRHTPESKPTTSEQRDAGGSSGAAHEDFRSFSIKYFSSGPTPYASSAEEPAEDTGTVGGYAAETGVTGEPSPAQMSPTTIVSPSSTRSSIFVPSYAELGLSYQAQLARITPPTTAPSVAPSGLTHALPAKPPVVRPPLPPFPHNLRFPPSAHPPDAAHQQTSAQAPSSGPPAPAAIVEPTASSPTSPVSERPSSALPALQARTPEQVQAEGREHGRRRSATSPPELVIPNPLETKVTEGEKVDTPSSLASELTVSSASPPVPTRHQGELSDSPAGPSTTPPLPQPMLRHEPLPSQAPAYATGLPVMTRPSFPPGSVCVVSRSTSGPFPAAHHAATVPNLPVITWTGGRQKSHSFHSITSNSVMRMSEMRPAARGHVPIAMRNIPPRQPPDTYPEADSVKLEKTRWPLVKVENVSSA